MNTNLGKIISFYNELSFCSNNRSRLFSEYFFEKFSKRSGAFLLILNIISSKMYKEKQYFSILLIFRNYLSNCLTGISVLNKQKILFSLIENFMSSKCKYSSHIKRLFFILLNDEKDQCNIILLVLEKISIILKNKINFRMIGKKTNSIFSLISYLLDINLEDKIEPRYFRTFIFEVNEITLFTMKAILNLEKSNTLYKNANMIIMCLKILEKLDDICISRNRVLNLEKRIFALLYLLSQRKFYIYMTKKTKIYLYTGTIRHLIKIFNKFFNIIFHFMNSIFDCFKMSFLRYTNEIFYNEFLFFFIFIIKKNKTFLRFLIKDYHKYISEFISSLLLFVDFGNKVETKKKISFFLRKPTYQDKLIYLSKIFNQFSPVEISYLLEMTAKNQESLIDTSDTFFENRLYFLSSALLNYSNSLTGVSRTLCYRILRLQVRYVEKMSILQVEKKKFSLITDFFNILRFQIPIRSFENHIQTLVSQFCDKQIPNSHVLTTLERMAAVKGNSGRDLMMYNIKNICFEKICLKLSAFYEPCYTSKGECCYLNKFVLRFLSNFLYSRKPLKRDYVSPNQECVINYILNEKNESSKNFLIEILFLLLQSKIEKNFERFSQILIIGKQIVYNEDLENLPFIISFFSKILSIEKNTQTPTIFYTITDNFLSPHALNVESLMKPVLHYLAIFFSREKLFEKKDTMMYFLTALETSFKNFNDFYTISIYYYYLYKNFKNKKRSLLHFIEVFYMKNRKFNNKRDSSFFFFFLANLLEEDGLKDQTDVLKKNFLTFFLHSTLDNFDHFHRLKFCELFFFLHLSDHMNFLDNNHIIEYKFICEWKYKRK